MVHLGTAVGVNVAVIVIELLLGAWDSPLVRFGGAKIDGVLIVICLHIFSPLRGVFDDSQGENCNFSVNVQARGLKHTHVCDIIGISTN